MTGFSHLNEKGEARIVDVGSKPVTHRRAVAQAIVRMRKTTLDLVVNQQMAKGDVLATARIAGLMAAKDTSRIIPLCHPIRLDSITIDFELGGADEIRIVGVAQATDRTGVEMEALTAVSVAALAVYDMCKGIDRGISIRDVRLLEKSGGRSGEWMADQSTE
jgi:cyclic pyranopterin monophosphate synthase